MNPAVPPLPKPGVYDQPSLIPIMGEIMAEPHENAGLDMQTVRQRYACLTTPLPLSGFDALRRDANGALQIIAALREEAPWMDEAIAAVELQLERQLLLGRPWVHLQPLLLVGPPGCGKSWLARRTGELAGYGSRTVDLAGASDGNAIIGNPRGWIAAMPSFPVLAMAETETANPICIVEEVDKAGGSERHGDPIAAMLPLLEPSTARAYRDRCLQTEVDTSAVSWILTANALNSRLSAPFLSRVQVVQVAMPPLEMADIIIGQLLADTERQWRVPPDMAIKLPQRLRSELCKDYLRHHSVRRLKRLIEGVAGFCLPERVCH